MTIENEVNDPIVYDGDDSATTFSFPFKVNRSSQVKVIIQDDSGNESEKKVDVDFSVANYNVEGSGVVTYPISGDPLPTGYKLSISPKMDYLQSTDLKNQGRFSAEIHEASFDTLMMHIKELKGLINRAILLKESSGLKNGEYGEDPEDNTLIAWDGTDGKTKNVTGLSSDAVATSFWKAVLSNTNFADSLSDLDSKNTVIPFKGLKTENKTDLTLNSSGVLNISDSNFWNTVDSYGAAASDDLVSFVVPKGTIFSLSQFIETREITIKYSSSVRLDGEYDFKFGKSTNSRIIFMCVDDSNTCIELARTVQSINLPSFSAKLSADQTPSSGVLTKINCNAENFDTNSYYDNATNYRFTPLVAGKYFVTATINNVSDASQVSELYIYKNGSQFLKVSGEYSGAGQLGLTISGIVDLNGTTDYIEIYGKITSGGTIFFDDGYSNFSAFRLF